MVIVTTAGPAPAPVLSSTSIDGLIKVTADATWAGALVEVDYRTLMPGAYAAPFRADVYRQTSVGTELVRSGNPVVGYGGRAWAYDHEAPLGLPALYWAVPRMADGSSGPASGGAAIVSTGPVGGMDDPGLWIKCLGRPELSVQVRATDWSAGTYKGRTSSADILSARNTASTWSTRGGHETQMTVLTTSRAEQDALQAVLDQGPVLVQGLAAHNRDDGYYLPTDLPWKRVGRTVHMYREWTIGLLEQDRPGTADQPLVVPGRSLARRQAMYPTFADVAFSGRPFSDGLLP
ncbi:hypothetical protein ACIBSV_46715 [Embleya sp. NPDC050154]|uniref:hypothetical protein n=1 Tax=Embleya sp. NPDC050154 TaxID=3363988 RepID=UPI0037AE54A8